MITTMVDLNQITNIIIGSVLVGAICLAIGICIGWNLRK